MNSKEIGVKPVSFIGCARLPNWAGANEKKPEWQTEKNKSPGTFCLAQFPIALFWPWEKSLNCGNAVLVKLACVNEEITKKLLKLSQLRKFLHVVNIFTKKALDLFWVITW